VAPIFPHEARSSGMNGEVLVEFVVDESGRVHDPRVVRASSPIFEPATLQAVAKWRFEPGKSHGRVVRFRMAVPVIFNVQEGL
jgi:protein TonB